MWIHIIYSIVLYILSLFLSKYKTFSRLFSLFVPIIMPLIFFEKFKSLRFFSKVKVISVFIPLLLYTNYDLIYPDTSPSFFWSSILFFNIIQVGILIGLTSKNITAIINGIFLIILSFYSPIFNYYSNIEYYGFENMTFVIAKTLLLVSTYLFNEFYYKGRLRYALIYSVLIPLIYSIYYNNTMMYVPLRIYSLTLVFLIDAIFPEIHHKMVEKLNKSFLWSTNKFNKLKIFYLFI